MFSIILSLLNIFHVHRLQLVFSLQPINDRAVLIFAYNRHKLLWTVLVLLYFNSYSFATVSHCITDLLIFYSNIEALF